MVGGVASAAFAYNPLMSVALPLLFLSGGAFILIVTSCNMLLQTMVPGHLRGRVMALYTISFIGMLPIGSLIYGGLADVLGGVQPVFVISGVVFVLFGYLLTRVIPTLRTEAHQVLGEDA